MVRCFMVCFFMLCACSAYAANGGNGGDGGNGDNSDGGNGSDGSATASGRDGCPGGTQPDSSGKFYLPDTKEPCNPGRQDAMKSAGH